jgi:type II secretion system protein G
MRNNKGFTLVEILIVVVILGILAAIVVPQFTSASSEAVKGALQSQIQTITSQVELYRVNNNGEYPFEAATNPLGGTTNDGWGVLVGTKYMKEAPTNGYTGNAKVEAQSGAAAAAYGATRTSTTGWFCENGTSATDKGNIFAAGFDPIGADGKAALAHEANFNGTSGATSGGSGGTTP